MMTGASVVRGLAIQRLIVSHPDPRVDRIKELAMDVIIQCHLLRCFNNK